MRLGVLLLLALPAFAQTFQLGATTDPWCASSTPWSPPALRYGSDFTCTFAGTPGSSDYYTVTLAFGEPTYSAAGGRSFDVWVDGLQVLTAYDPVAHGATLTVASRETVPATSLDGFITVRLKSRLAGHNAVLSTVTVTPLTHGSIDRYQCHGSVPPTPTVAGWDCTGFELYRVTTDSTGARDFLATPASAVVSAWPACPTATTVACWQLVTLDAPIINMPPGSSTLPIGPQQLRLKPGTFGYLDVLVPGRDVAVWNVNIRLDGMPTAANGFPDLSAFFFTGTDPSDNPSRGTYAGVPCQDGLPICSACCALVVSNESAWPGMPTYRVLDGRVIPF